MILCVQLAYYTLESRTESPAFVLANSLWNFLHLCTFRPTKIYIRTLKGADINFVGNSLKDYKPQVRFVIFNGINEKRCKKDCR